MKFIYGRQYFFLKSNENQDFSSDEISFRVNDSSFPTLCELWLKNSRAILMKSNEASQRGDIALGQ